MFIYSDTRVLFLTVPSSTHHERVRVVVIVVVIVVVVVVVVVIFFFFFPRLFFLFFSSLDTEEEKRQEIEKILQKADEVEVRPVVAGSLYVRCYFGMKKTLRTLASVVPPLLPPYRTQRIYTLI